MRKVGAMVEVEPVISDDSRTIELVIAPELTDFEGFVNYGSPILSPGSSSYLPISGGAFAIATDYLGNPVKPSAAVPITVIPVPLLGKPLPLNPVAPFPYVAYPPPGAPAPYNPPSGFPGPWWITHDILRWLPFLQPEQLITPNYILQPVFKKQKVSTSVRIWDGQTVVLGGVKKQEHTLVEDAVPILGDLPFIGRLFRTNTKKTDTKNVVIFVTAEIIDPTGQKIRRSTQSTSTTP
jgi:Flp pilus assembly secretin CpaC